MERCAFAARLPRRWALLLGFGCAAAGAWAPGTTDALPIPKSGAILGGTADTTHDAVMALLQLETATTAFACSGTTIAQTGTSAFLLTAAHCVVQHDTMEQVVLPLTVAAPSVMTALPGPDWQASNSQGRKFVVAAISVAPGYDGATDSPNDLAIVRFTTNMPSLPLIPILEPADDTLGVGSPLTLVGYGETEIGVQNSIRQTVARERGFRIDVAVDVVGPRRRGPSAAAPAGFSYTKTGGPKDTG